MCFLCQTAESLENALATLATVPLDGVVPQLARVNVCYNSMLTCVQMDSRRRMVGSKFGSDSYGRNVFNGWTVWI
jgi:hypothetical protein